MMLEDMREEDLGCSRGSGSRMSRDQVNLLGAFACEDSDGVKVVGDGKRANEIHGGNLPVARGNRVRLEKAW